MKKFGILLIDDHAMFRNGISALLKCHNEFEILGEAADGLEGMQKVVALKPDLVISDLSMPKLSGTDGIRLIKKRSPHTKTLVLTVHKAEEYLHAALDAGADGYILKDDDQNELLTAINRIRANKIYLSPSVTRNIVGGYLGHANGSGSPHKASWESLTHRELQILKLIAESHRNKDIAEILSISPKTVEKHRSNLMKKLNLHTISSLTAYTLRHGLISKE